MPTYLNDSASYCRINNRKELHFSLKMNIASDQLFVWFIERQGDQALAEG
jgi:hypothetical protein